MQEKVTKQREEVNVKCRSGEISVTQMVIIAFKLYFGVEYVKDEKQSIEIFRACASEGNVLSNAMLYFSGALGEDYKDSSAFALFNKCYKDSKEAMEEEGVEEEKREELSYALNMLAFMHKSGRGTPRNNKKAVKFYCKSCEQGNSLAMSNLAILYEHGLGVEKDYNKALELLKLSAEKKSDSPKFSD